MSRTRVVKWTIVGGLIIVLGLLLNSILGPGRADLSTYRRGTALHFRYDGPGLARLSAFLDRIALPVPRQNVKKWLAELERSVGQSLQELAAEGTVSVLTFDMEGGRIINGRLRLPNGQIRRIGTVPEPLEAMAHSLLFVQRVRRSKESIRTVWNCSFDRMS